MVHKFSQGVVDCLFRHKFEAWVSEDNVEFLTPNFCKSFSNEILNKKLSWSVPAGILGRACDLHLEHFRQENDLVRELGIILKSASLKSNALILEGVELRPEDDNVFTENLEYYCLENESLIEIENQLDFFNDSACYVIKWTYRLERKGIKFFAITTII